MTLNRRNFLEGALAAGALTNLLSDSDVVRAAEEQSEPQAVAAVGTGLAEQDSYPFWSHFLDPADPSVRKTRGGVHLAAAERKVEFLHSSPHGLRSVDDIEEHELLDHPGDVEVSMVLGQFRPSTEDQEYLKENAATQLRVDCVQTKPFIEFLAPLAWSSLALIKTKTAIKLPSLQELGFHSPGAMSGVNRILLPGGRGKMAVNIYVTKSENLLHRIAKDVLIAAPFAAQVMNLPAISVIALRTVSELYSRLEERASFLLNSALVDAVATRQALEDPDRSVNYVHLLSGDYLLVPKAHIDELKPHLPKLEVRQGYLVEKDASPTDPVETRAEQAVPGVTYATLKMTVNPWAAGMSSSVAIGCGPVTTTASSSKSSTSTTAKTAKEEPAKKNP